MHTSLIRCLPQVLHKVLSRPRAAGATAGKAGGDGAAEANAVGEWQCPKADGKAAADGKAVGELQCDCLVHRIFGMQFQRKASAAGALETDTSKPLALRLLFARLSLVDLAYGVRRFPFNLCARLASPHHCPHLCCPCWDPGPAAPTAGWVGQGQRHNHGRLEEAPHLYLPARTPSPQESAPPLTAELWPAGERAVADAVAREGAGGLHGAYTGHSAPSAAPPVFAAEPASPCEALAAAMPS